MNTIYDNLIKTAVADHLPGVDWRLIKAQLMQESTLDPSKTSKAGAMGLAQFMPKTWADMQKQLHFTGSAYEPELAIPACAYYMRSQIDRWTARRPEADRYCLALASYNAGFGHLLGAQKRAGGVSDYRSIVGHLHLVTGAANAKETRDYVRRIYGYWLGYVIG